MSVETAWPNWIDRPILFRLYDLINEVQRPAEEAKQTLIDAANEISDLVNEAKTLEDDNDDEHIETLVNSKDYAKLEAENAALREVIAEISIAAINPALDRPGKLDLVQSILIDWHRGKAADAAKEQA